jgi:hypothetical protein
LQLSFAPSGFDHQLVLRAAFSVVIILCLSALTLPF